VNYELKVTGRALLCSLPLLALCIYLAWLGNGYLKQFHPADPVRYLFAGPPLLLSLLLLTLWLGALWSLGRGRIQLETAGVRYRRGSTTRLLRWTELRIQPLDPGATLFRKLVLCERGGGKDVQVYELFLPSLGELHECLQKVRAQHVQTQPPSLLLD